MLSGLLRHTPKLKFLLKDNSTTILTGVGVAGTVATAYLTGRASFRAAEIIAQENQKIETFNEENEVGNLRDLTTIEKAQKVWPQYIPPAVMGLITITSIIASHKISSNKIAALVVASGISDRALNEYKAKVIEKFGERKETDIHDEIAQERVLASPSNSREIVLAGTGEVLCFDTLTGRYFQSTVESIRRAENRVNYECIHFMSASLSMFYEEIGLPPTDYTDSVGWNMNNVMEVQISTVMSQDNRPCLAIGFTRNPIPEYDKTWT
jgi:Family of unknown function (DUF6353)